MMEYNKMSLKPSIYQDVPKETIMAPKNCTTRMKKGDIILH
jgi:hypothetical protein